jgi:hypothetical protein
VLAHLVLHGPWMACLLLIQNFGAVACARTPCPPWAMDGKGEFPPGKQGSGSHCHRVVAASCVGGRGQRTRPGGEVTGGAGDVEGRGG